MDDFGQILRKIVQNNRRVIIPDFGAFINNTQEKTIVFSTLLKYNDGFLEEELKKNGMDNPAVLLEKFVKKIFHAVETGKQFNIAGLGFFVREGDNIKFVSEEPAEENAGFQESNQNPDSNPDKVPSSVHRIPKERYDKKKFSLIFVLILFCVIILGSVFYILLTVGGNDPVKSMVGLVEKPTNQFVITQVEEPTAPEEINPRTLSESAFHYYIIAGCFEHKANADNFVAQCKKAGYHEAVILSKIGYLFPVAINCFSSLDEALSEQKKYNEIFDDCAWIYRTK
ncbi:MAG: SPOR domain-containing protein [Prevotellaceae bacterium]|jgi:hypothetical protein|nr:SPOR domain-containing protein [Prevotellaceae bacterium]